ncbi:hypothetical protein [Caulobacter segnis]|uniref:Transmembrane protein n=1 Tax=Caulobacter segnis TaxID=88688 RepID=A0A2W5WMJ3_9CAUL|nr:hypothetical protein [Caulobacter segnis]PZR35208.1 MAG: hypothetical protein DI526_07875 [Caulobacter segnis]
MTRDEDALRMLAEVEAANADMAERAKAPVWYHPVLGLLMGGLAVAQAVPIVWQYAYFPICGLGIWLLVKSYVRKTGMWVYGYRAGRTRIVAVALATLTGATMLTSGWLFHMKHVSYAPYVAGAIIAVMATIGGFVWEAAFRADLRDGRPL